MDTPVPLPFSSTRAYLLEARYEFLRLLRTPSFSLPCLLFPPVFYLLFGVLLGGKGGPVAAQYLLAGWALFGREKPIEVRTAPTVAMGDGGAAASVLDASGYGDAEIEYRSHRTTVHQSHLVHDIQFQHQPKKRVIITVNVGLLSAQSPLPSFMMRTMEQLDHDRLERFVGYFDHLLLQECFAGLFPERNEALLPGWEGAAWDRLRLLRPTCASTLHWLFCKAFPEAELSVRREVRRQKVPSAWRNPRAGQCPPASPSPRRYARRPKPWRSVPTSTWPSPTTRPGCMPVIHSTSGTPPKMRPAVSSAPKS